jgi:V/A-type H+-transporting ATPase subunit I
MIVKMKRLNLLCLTSARDATLKRLQEMGVVHVTSLRPPESRALETSRNHLAYIKRALETMPRKTTVPPSGLPADVVVSLVWTMLQDKKDNEDALADLQQEWTRVQPFGSFDPSMISSLRQRNIFIKLYVAPPGAEVSAPSGAVVVEINKDKAGVYLALISREDMSLPFAEFRQPDRSLKDIESQIAEYKLRLEDCSNSLRLHEGDHEAVAMLRDQLDDTVCFLEAREGMGTAAPVALLRGYLPADQAESMLTMARQEGWGIQIEDPAPDEDVPTMITNPRWVRPIKAVLRGINVLPGYNEVDMSAMFLIFFSLFFAILIGDAGYGVLFLVATRLTRLKFKKSFSAIFSLLTITSLCTISWGVITGTYFGMAVLPPVLEGLKIDWLTDENNMMSLCFLIGAIHLTVAHVWNIFRMAPNPVALSQLGWIAMTWTMYFGAKLLVLSVPMPGFVVWMAVAGAILILLFMTPLARLKDEWFQHVMFPLSIVSNFVDVVSYLRLFAVGFASLAVAQSFNAMATAGGISGVWSGLAAACILFVGHALNIILGALGILVHGVRLNTLEFSSHLGVQWAGHPFTPFAYKRTELKKQQKD